MSEFSAAPLENNFYNARLLANITDSSVMLQVHDTASNIDFKPSIINLDSEDVLFYNDVIVADKTSSMYNESTILNYISTGILSDVTVNPIGPSI